MINIELDKKPIKPTIIEGFPGFGFVSTIVTEYLVKHLDAKPIGRITSDKLSPVIAIHNSKLIYPLEIFYDDKTNILILQAVTPIEGLEWEIAGVVMELAKQVKAKEIIGLEGVHSNATSQEPKVFFHTNKIENEKNLKSRKIESLDEGIILGPTAALLIRSKELPFTAFFVEAASNLPDNKAASKIIQTLNDYLGLKIDPKPLLQKAKEFETKIKQIISQVEEAKVTKEQKEKNLGYMG